MIDNHSEIEYKFCADSINLDNFNDYCEKKKPYRRKFVKGVDQYYSQNNNVIRHRQDPQGKNELTLKLRKSNKSITNRLEIDLHFDINKTSTKDISRFLELSGWKETLRIIKDTSIFWFKRGKIDVSVVGYVVWRINGSKELDMKKFIEIEVEKGSDVSLKEAKKHLNLWKKDIEKNFGKLKQLNNSIYEIYTNKKIKRI